MNIPNLLENISSEPEDTVLMETAVEYKNFLTTNCAEGCVLNIIHLNIRSLQRNYDELVILVNSLKNIDIIILSETFILSEVSFFAIDGYSIFYNHAEFNKNDGVVMYIKNNLNIISVDTIKLSQITLLRAIFTYNNITHGITSFYRMPAAGAETFITEFSQYLTELNKNMIEIYVGDVNIDLLNKDSRLVNEYCSLADSNGYISYINKTTRVTSTTSSCLDHFFVRNIACKNHIKASGFVLQNAITDHYTVLLNLHYNKKNKIGIPKEKTISKIDFNKLDSLLSSEKWTNVFNSQNPIYATNSFVNTFNTHLKSCTTKIKLKKKEIKLTPWITHGIMRSIRKRDNLKKRILRTLQPSDNQISHFKTYRNVLTKCIKTAKYNYYKQKINNSGNNYKNIWNCINEVSGYRQRKYNKIQCLKINNQNISDPSEIAEQFNDHFINIGIEMAKKIVNLTTTSDSMPRNHINSIFIPPINHNNLISIINKLKINSSPGKDGITPKVIKLTHIHIIHALQHIINLIISTGTVPSCFKLSVVTPIHKSGSKSDKNNYRPISQINCFAKIFETYIKNCLLSFLKTYNLLSDKQYGFLSGLSTESAMNQLVSEVLGGFNAQRCSVAVFLDLARAFDTVPHTRLLGKLEGLGVRGKALNLIESYLSNRLQYVKVDDTYSEPKCIKIGIPQGTVLGPLLFLVYINDLYGIVANSNIISYADDTAIICSADNWDEAKSKTEHELDKVKRWLDTNFLTLNVQKTRFVAFSVLANHQPLYKTIKISDNNTIEKTNNIKYLGIVIDQHLRWDCHANYLAQKLRKFTYIFYTLRNILNNQMLKLVYSSLIESIIRYGINIWGSLLPTHVYNLQIAQNSILKIMFKLERLFPTYELYTKNQVCNVKQIYFHTLLCWIFKSKKTLQTVSHPYQTRSNTEGFYTRNKYNSFICQRQPEYLGPKHYNYLPDYLKAITSFKKFSKSLKTYILNNFHAFKD